MQTKSKAALRQPGRFGGNEKGHLLGSEHRQNDSGTWPLPVWGLQATFSSTQKRGCAHPRIKWKNCIPIPSKVWALLNLQLLPKTCSPWASLTTGAWCAQGTRGGICPPGSRSKHPPPYLQDLSPTPWPSLPSRAVCAGPMGWGNGISNESEFAQSKYEHLDRWRNLDKGSEVW